MNVRLATLLFVLFVMGLPGTGRADSGPHANQWPSLGHTNGHTAFTPDVSMTPTKAKTLGIRWMADLYAADLGSPIVAYDAALGKQVVYAGNERGDVFAFDAATGTEIWSTNIGVGLSERDTPLFVDGNVFIGSAYNAKTVKLDGATGTMLCSTKGPASFLASPMAATPPGGVPMVYISTIDEPGITGPVFGIRQSDCGQVFKFTDYVSETGPWASSSYGVDAKGQPLDVIGTADPDTKLYAMNANTGALDWVFRPANPAPGNYDIGAAATISPPGTNGFADGVAYVPTKYGIMYAIDLTTGSPGNAPIWQFDFNADSGATEGGISSAALAGNDLVFGYNGGLYDLNATNGAKIWQYEDPTGTEVVASPAIVGSLGNAVVAFTNIAGFFSVIGRADATPLYAYRTGGYVTSSPAYANDTFYMTSTDGFLYAFSPGGSRAAKPTTTITSPARNAAVAFGNGAVTVTGTATNATGIASVGVAVQSGGSTGPWYDAATSSWTAGPYANPATIVKTATGATWSLTIPLPPGGSALDVVANAVGTGGIADVAGVTSNFTSAPSPTQPVVALATTIAPPGGTVIASASAFAPNESVTFSFAGTTLGSATAHSNGRIPATPLVLPTKAAFGPGLITATGKRSGNTSSTTLDVENAWVSFGDGGARTNFEPNDTVLARVLHVGPGIFLSPAYFVPYPATAPVESSPAVFDDVAFFGNDAGTMNAIDTHLGSSVWQYQTPSGMAITSAPAIDSGYLAFGSTDGTLYELAVASGTEVGSIALGGTLTSPAAANGDFFVASKNGTVSAVEAASGTLVWQHNVGASISGSVAVDAASGLLVIADDKGYVSGYRLTDGTRSYHVEIGGALRDAPALFGGIGYVGSSNGNLVAFAETTGQKIWTFAEGSAISATPVVATGEAGFTGVTIYVGSADGNVTALTQYGALGWRVPFPSAVVGLAATIGNVVMVELANGIVGATRGPNDGHFFYQYQTTGSLGTSPAIVSGAVYVGSGTGGIYAFTPYGKAPLLRSTGSTARQRLLANGAKPAWLHSSTTSIRAAAFVKTMVWSSSAVARPHILGAPVRGVPALRFHGGPLQHAPQIYAIYRRPPGSTMPTTYRAATERWLTSSGRLIAAFSDATPFAVEPSETEFARDVARVAASERWHIGPDTQIVVLTAPEAFGRWAGFCAYHGVATEPDGSRIAYAVVPYPSPASFCGTGGGIEPTGDVDADLVLPTLARERAAMASDPFGSGWYDAAGREASDFLAP